MLVDFYNTMPDDARIWIYASEKSFTKDQEIYIIKTISNHLQNWEAHKLPLTAAVTILERHFIVVALDESKNRASGCSIDTLQHNIQQIEKKLSISLMNRLNIFYNIDGRIKHISSCRLSSVANSDTLFYDLTIQKKLDLESYLKPISHGWCAHLLNKL